MEQSPASDPYDEHIHKRKQKQMIYENLKLKCNWYYHNWMYANVKFHKSVPGPP